MGFLKKQNSEKDFWWLKKKIVTFGWLEKYILFNLPNSFA